jgi:AAA+ ATPase superfamily predicted ATPase
MDIIGRHAEKAALEKYYRSNEPELVAITGRRRVGKTFLIRNSFNDEFFFYITGVRDSNLATTMERFHKAMREYGFQMETAPKSWAEAFDALKHAINKAGAKNRKVIFFDELPWLDTPRSGFIQEFDYFWNSFASARSDVLFLICGSAASWMANKIFRATGGLHNRVTGRIFLKPFSLAECEDFFAARNIVIDRHDITEAYMIFGGIPYYLRYWDGQYGLPQNIDRIVFRENAPLKDEFALLYDSLFKSPDRHIEIIAALGRRKKGLTREELLLELKRKDGGKVTDILNDLEMSGFIRRYESYPDKTKGSIFQLVDNYSLFHLAFVARRGNLDEHYWSNMHNTPKLNSWRGYAFEQVCLKHIEQIKAALGISGVMTRVSSWRSNKANPGVQIDLILDRSDRIVNLCEIKFAKYEYEIDKKYGMEMRRRVSAFMAETNTRQTPHVTFITTYGVKRNAHSSVMQSEVRMDDLFAKQGRLQ